MILVLGRRRFLTAAATLPIAGSGLGQDEAPVPGLRLVFSAAHPPALPPALTLGPEAGLELEFRNTGSHAQCSLSLQVRLDSQPHLLPLAIWTSDRHHYWHLREALQLPAYRGLVASIGDAWSLAISGRQEFSARARPRISEASASGANRPWISYRHGLSPVWAEGPLTDQPIELWRLSPAGPDVGTRIGLPQTSGELGGWLARLGASGPVSAVSLPERGASSPEFVRHMAAPEFEPFALRNYPGGSLGIPEIDTLFCGPDALRTYRSHSRVRLAGVLIVSVDCMVNPHLLSQLVPPPCVVDSNALVRVMAIRGLSDPALDEAWLLARCWLAGERAWYALSHLKGSLAGSAFGREVWGYPTRQGTAKALLGAKRFTSSVTRGNRSLYHAEGTYGGFSTGTSLNEMSVVTLRPRVGAQSGPVTGELLVQPWYYQGLRKPFRRESLRASFPAPAAGTASENWSRMGPVDAYRADIYDHADLQRLPARLAGEVSDIGPYYRDRCDGRLPWERPLSAG